MNIQLAEEYNINVEKEEKERGFLERVGAGAWERKDIWSWGLKEEGLWSRGSREGVGAGAREKRDAVRNMSMKRRRN